MAFYIIGTKFGGRTNHSTNVYPKMIEESAAFVGFYSIKNLSKLYLKEASYIKEYLLKKNESSASSNSLSKYLNIREGDLIALKDFSTNEGGKQRLKVKAIALVKGKNGQTYFYDPQYGHGIYLEFLDINIDKEYEMVYMQTVHKLSNKNHIKELFANYLDQEQINLLNYKVPKELKFNLENHLREISKRNLLVKVDHKKIQKNLYDMLIMEYGEQNVQIEINGIDILVNSISRTIIYEIKSYDDNKQCIRDAIGQLLEYKWYNKNLFKSNNISLVIVGQNELSKEEEKYMKYIKSCMNEKIEYLAVPI